MTFLRNLLLTLSALAWVAAASGPAAAEPITPQENAANKLNLADRQRLLTEQMGLAICLVMGDVNVASASDKARGSADLFDTTMRALRGGDTNMGILPEESPDVLGAIDHVEALFSTYRAATLQVGAGDLHSVPVTQIMTLSEPLLGRADAMMDVFDRVYGAAAGGASQRKTLDLARRQTMLTQKLAKEVCFASLGIDTAEMTARARQTISQFENAQRTLEEGDPGRGILTPNLRRMKKLEAVRALWAPYAKRARAMALGGGAGGSAEDLEELVKMSNVLLFKTKQAARSYAL